MIRADVIVVGGGPAGSSCAWRLVRHGFDVLVLDRSPFPRVKLCGGLVTQEAARALELHETDYPHGWLWIDRFHFHWRGRRLPLPSPQISVRRVEFDHFLLRRSGARFEVHRVRRIERGGAGFVIDGTYTARFLVGAGGTACPVYRTFFREDGIRRKDLQITALELEFEHEVRERDCHFWFFEEGFPGYYWYIPKADGWVNVGVGALSESLARRQDGIRRHWERCVAKLRGLGWLDADVPEPGGHTDYLVDRPARPEREGAYLVGDAAGLATRDLGEGIRAAIESGIRAADAIATGRPYAVAGIARTSTPSLLKALLRRRWWR